MNYSFVKKKIIKKIFYILLWIMIIIFLCLMKKAWKNKDGTKICSESYRVFSYWDQRVYNYAMERCEVESFYAINSDHFEEGKESADKNDQIENDTAKNENNKMKSVETITAMADYKQADSNMLSNFDTLKNNCFVVDGGTYILPNELDGENLTGMDLTIDMSGDEYKILIYHTHSTEAFADSRSEKRADTIVGMGDLLAKTLRKKYGVKVYHDDTAYDMMGGYLDRSAAYDYARKGVQEILDKYPSIEVVIDLHRDGVSEGTRLIADVDGKSTAQIMLLTGMSRLADTGDIEYLPNENKEENIAFALQTYLTGRANYEGLMRKIFVRGYRYNLDLRGRSLLVELGSQTNTVKEEKRGVKYLAAILYKVLSGA